MVDSDQDKNQMLLFVCGTKCVCVILSTEVILVGFFTCNCKSTPLQRSHTIERLFFNFFFSKVISWFMLVKLELRTDFCPPPVGNWTARLQQLVCKIVKPCIQRVLPSFEDPSREINPVYTTLGDTTETIPFLPMIRRARRSIYQRKISLCIGLT